MADTVVSRSTTKFVIATFIKVESSAMMKEDRETSIRAVQPILMVLLFLSKKIPQKYYLTIVWGCYYLKDCHKILGLIL